MAAVFLMQPLGQLFSQVVGLAVLLTVGKSRGLASYGRELEGADLVPAKMIVDTIWRYVIGVGAIPAFIAIVFRLTIPESPRYTLDVDNDGTRALQDTQRYFNIRHEQPNHVSENLHLNVHHGKENQPLNGQYDLETGHPIQSLPVAATGLEHLEETNDNDSDSMDMQVIGDDEEDHHQDEANDEELRSKAFSRADIKQYFITEGNIKYLLGTSITWFLLDFACKYRHMVMLSHVNSAKN